MNQIAESLSIDEVSRDTGLGKDTLRVWERRYGFPNPERGARGERRYPLPQMERLRMVRRLMDQGYRPGRILSLDENALQVLHTAGDEIKPQVLDERISSLINLDHATLERAFRQYIDEMPALEFSQKIVTPMLDWIGQQWVLGRLKIHEEHAITQVLQNVLVEAVMNRTTDKDKKRVLLTTIPGEKHFVGLLMVELVMRELGWPTINIGMETPVDEILLAAEKHQARIIALSFSAGQSRARTVSAMQWLTEHSPEVIQMVAGGQGIKNLRRLPSGITVIKNMADLNKLLKKIEAKIV